MATITTGGSGNWSSTTPNAPWPGGTLPTSADDVVVAKNTTLTIDVTTAVANSISCAIGTTGADVGGILTCTTSANWKLTVAAQQAGLKAQQAALESQGTEIKAAQDALNLNYKIADLELQLQEQQAVQHVNETMQASQQMEPAESSEPAEPQMDVASILQAVASMQQPINITVPVQVDGKGQVSKQGRAVRQQDGSYLMESIETPVGE